MSTIRASLALFLVLLPLSLWSAPVDETLGGWRHPLTLSGPLMEVGPDYLIVCERRVTLVNATVAGRSLKTRIRGQAGQTLDLSDLRAGQQLIVKGGVVLSGQSEVFLARDIWVVPDSRAASLERLRQARPEAW